MTDSLSIEKTAPRDSIPAIEQQIQHLMVAVEHELRNAPRGLSELGLIRALQNPPWSLLGAVNLRDPEKLYPVHFLLFHVLYRLRDRLAEDGELLTISPMNIRLRPDPVVAGNGLPGDVDDLRNFYLDLEQYRMPENSIRKMMDDFWSGRTMHAPGTPDIANAARLLGFDQVPENFAEVKLQFRRAVMRAHPDRGGDTQSVQTLNEAFSVLKLHFHVPA